MMKFWQALRWPPRRLVLWHSIAAIPMGAVVVLGAWLSYHYHELTIENRGRVDHAYEVLDIVDGLFISVQNADVAQRDYIITGDAAPLATFQAALNLEAEDSERLRVLFSSSPTQETNLAKLDLAVSAKLGELGRTIAVRQGQGFEAARNMILHGDGGKSMGDIRQQVSLIGDNERKLLIRRQAAGRKHERDTLLVGALLATMSVATRLLIALGLKRLHGLRQEAVGELSE